MFTLKNPERNSYFNREYFFNIIKIFNRVKIVLADSNILFNPDKCILWDHYKGTDDFKQENNRTIARSLHSSRRTPDHTT